MDRSFKVCPNFSTAVILMPEVVEARFKNPQTLLVFERAKGIALMRFSSADVIPLWTRAPKPPIKSIPALQVAASRAFASPTAVSIFLGKGSNSRDAGVIEIRRFVMGMPYLFSTLSANLLSLIPLKK